MRHGAEEGYDTVRVSIITTGVGFDGDKNKIKSMILKQN